MKENRLEHSQIRGNSSHLRRKVLKLAKVHNDYSSANFNRFSVDDHHLSLALPITSSSSEWFQCLQHIIGMASKNEENEMHHVSHVA